jgi:hypothetical protein
MEAQTQKAQPELVCDGLHLLKVVARLLADLVHGVQGRAGEFELSAGLEADIGPAAAEGDQGLAAVRAVFVDALPAESHQPLQHRLDAVRAVIGDGLVAAQMEAELFVFGADTPFAGRLGADGEIVRQVVQRQRTIVTHSVGHQKASLPGFLVFGGRRPMSRPGAIFTLLSSW